MYSISSEWSQNFVGFRARVENEVTNKLVYLGGTMWKTEQLAEKEAEIYISAYLTHGDKHANRMVAKFKKENGK